MYKSLVSAIVPVPPGIVCVFSVPDNVVLPATLSPTLFRSCSSSDFCLLTIVKEPFPLTAVSISPSSELCVGSVILPVTFA